MKVSLIAAVSQNGVIGKDGKLPWHIPDDLRRFKELTINKAVIMGRKTYESIGRPLPDRFNIVLTSDKKKLSDVSAQDLRVIFIPSLKGALKVCEVLQFSEVFVIGGSDVYKEALKEDLVDKIYLTRVRKDYDGDAYFPMNTIDYLKWKVASQEDYLDFSFADYERNW